MPFRDSVLTRMLQESIGGDCKTCLVVCALPADSDVTETLNAALRGARQAVKNVLRSTLRSRHRRLRPIRWRRSCRSSSTPRWTSCSRRARVRACGGESDGNGAAAQRAAQEADAQRLRRKQAELDEALEHARVSEQHEEEADADREEMEGKMSEMEEKLAEMEKRLEAETNEANAARAAAEAAVKAAETKAREAAKEASAAREKAATELAACEEHESGG